jgi:hypothetical protein
MCVERSRKTKNVSEKLMVLTNCALPFVWLAIAIVIATVAKAIGICISITIVVAFAIVIAIASTFKFPTNFKSIVHRH